jgi:hypothetical protein
VLFNVCPAHFLEGFLAGRINVVPRQSIGVAADILEALIAGRRRNQEHGGVGTLDGKVLGVGAGLPAYGRDLQPGLKFQRAGDSISLAVYTAEHERTLALASGRSLLWCFEARGKRNPAGLIGADSQDDALVHRAERRVPG